MATSQFNSHQVDILFNLDPNPICAGTLISSYLVLTVFGCLKGENATKLKVRAPSGNASTNQQIRAVDTIHSYPALKSEPSDNDIAVLLMDTDFQLGESLKVLEIIKRNSDQPEEYFSLPPSSSSTSCGNIKVNRTEELGCNRTTDKPNSICVKPSHQSSCPDQLPVPVIGSGLVCKVHGSSFLCGALVISSTSFRAYTDISKYLHWIRLTFGTRPEKGGDKHNTAGMGPAIFKGREVSSSGVSTSIPYQLSLQERRRGVWHHICGAVIIDSKTALTAAHCFDNNYGISEYRVVAGVTKLDSNSTTKQTLQLQRIIRHSDYKIQKWWRGNDIAIAHVTGSFVFNENVQNIWISPPQGINSTDFRGRASGWGKTSNSGGASNSLQEEDMEIWSDSECNNVWPELFKSSMICSYDNVSNICKGDSGGPLVVQNYQFNQQKTRDLLVGVASFSAEDCEMAEMPNGFTEVSHFLEWIKRNRAFKCGATEFQCLNGGCIDECSLCSGTDECGDGSEEKQCEEEMDVEKMRRCLRKNQQELRNVTYSRNQTISKLEEVEGILERAEEQLGNEKRSQSLTINRLQKLVNRTLIRVEEKEKDVENKTRRIEELEHNERILRVAEKTCSHRMLSQNETINRLQEEVKSLNRTLSQKLSEPNCPREGNMTGSRSATERARQKEDQGHLSSFPPAAAYFYYAGAGSHRRLLWNYNATTNEPCFNFARTLYSVFVKGSSCVAFHQAADCTQEIFRMDSTKASLSSVQDIRISSDVGQSSKSIGVCSSF